MHELPTSRTRHQPFFAVQFRTAWGGNGHTCKPRRELSYLDCNLYLRICLGTARAYTIWKMDIPRHDVKRRRGRQKIVWAVAALLVIAATLLLAWRTKSRHHRDYVAVPRHEGAPIQTLVDIPNNLEDKAPVVVLVHEVYGLSPWAKGMADQLAEQGFVVVAPDLLSGYGPHAGGYDDFTSEDERVAAIRDLDPASVLADLDSTVQYGKRMPTSNGKIAVVGFSWGGWESFAFAAHRRDLSAVFVFYGTDAGDVTSITAPVYGFYGGADDRVTGTVPATTEAMKAAGKFFEPVTYDKADHGFMRVGEDFLDRTNRKARNEAFDRLVRLLREMGAAKE